jgi:hypothetical protein
MNRETNCISSRRFQFILVQMHHKIETFEHVNKKLVLVIQDKLLAYMTREFNFAHLRNPATLRSLHSLSFS